MVDRRIRFRFDERDHESLGKLAAQGRLGPWAESFDEITIRDGAGVARILVIPRPRPAGEFPGETRPA